MSGKLLDRKNAPPGRHLSSPQVAYLLMLASSLAFAAMTTCGHALASRCDWRITAVARAALALVIVFAVAKRAGVPLVFRGPRTLWVRSIVGSIGMLLTFYAMKELPVSTLLTLTNTFPIWVTLLAWPVFGERPTAGFGLALVSGVYGVYLIENPQGGPIRPATYAALGAAVLTAVVMLGLHRLRRVNSLAIVVHFSGVATVACLGYALATFAGQPIDLGALRRPDVVSLLLGVGALASVGQIAMTRAFRTGAPQRLAVVGLAQVVFAMGFEHLFWPAAIARESLAGTVLILAPVAWLLARRRA